MRHNDNPPPYPALHPLEPVPGVHDDEINAVDDIVEEFFAAVDFSFEEDVLTYYSPPQSPAPGVFQIHLAQVEIVAENNVWQPPNQLQEDDHDENQLIYALDALQEDEGEQIAVQMQLLDDDEDILELKLLQIDPQPCHSRDPISPFSDNEGKVLVPSSPILSEYGSPPHLSPFWRSDAIPPSPLPLPGPSRMEIIDEVAVALEHEPMEIVDPDPEPEVRSETVPVPQPAEPLPSTSRGTPGIWSTGLALGVDGSGRMTGLNVDFTSEVTDPAKDPGKGPSKKRNISSASSSAGSSRNRSKNKSCLQKTDSNGVLTRSRAPELKHDAKKSKRESRSTDKKRSCNSEEPRRDDRNEEENIDNPIRPTYPGGAGNCVKKFPSIPGVKEWFAKQHKEHELVEVEPDQDELENLEYKTWDCTRSKCRARRTVVPAETKRFDLEEPITLDGCSEDEQEDEEADEEEEKEEEEHPSRRGRGRPRKNKWN